MEKNKFLINIVIVLSLGILFTIFFTFSLTTRDIKTINNRLDQSNVVDSLKLEILVKDKMLYNVREKIDNQEQIYESDINREKYTIINSPLESNL